MGGKVIRKCVLERLAFDQDLAAKDSEKSRHLWNLSRLYFSSLSPHQRSPTHTGQYQTFPQLWNKPHILESEVVWNVNIPKDIHMEMRPKKKKKKVC